MCGVIILHPPHHPTSLTAETDEEALNISTDNIERENNQDYEDKSGGHRVRHKDR